MRMEQATASSNAVEIRLQELRSNTVTRGREWLQCPGCPGRNFRNGASQIGKCSECGPWTGQEVAHGWRAAHSIVGSLGTPNGGRVRQ